MHVLLGVTLDDKEAGLYRYGRSELSVQAREERRQTHAGRSKIEDGRVIAFVGDEGGNVDRRVDSVGSVHLSPSDRRRR